MVRLLNFVVVVALASMLAAAAYFSAESSYTIYRRVGDGVVMKVLDNGGRRVNVASTEVDKLVGDVVWVSPDYNPDK